MAVLPSELKSLQAEDEPLLRNGDHMDQPRFHSLYERMPEGFRAELIGGIVFVASPVRKPHRKGSYQVANWLGAYQRRTPGVEGLGEGTVILGPEDEPEPDATLTILTEYGGRTREEGAYHVGAPELAIEVAHATVAIDLHRKRLRYEAAGIDEYIVFLEDKQEVRWFALREGRYRELEADADGVYRSPRFPGLWLSPRVFWDGDLAGVDALVEAGCASPEHAAFVAALQEARSR